MMQKLLINVESPKPLQSYGDGHVLLFNETSQNYYVTTREALFAVQDAKIKKIEEKLEKFMKEETELNSNFEKKIEEITVNHKKKVKNDILSFENNTSKIVSNFINEMSKKEANFLKQYQETNAKLIDMVKKLIIEE